VRFNNELYQVAIDTEYNRIILNNMDLREYKPMVTGIGFFHKQCEVVGGENK